MPVVELFKRASLLAEAALCTHKSEDLELAFAGDARGAFVWLQCFLGEEEDWCHTRGCPGTTLTFCFELITGAIPSATASFLVSSFVRH